MAPVSTLGPQATSLKTRLRIRFSASGPLPKKMFGAATGAATEVSDPGDKEKEAMLAVAARLRS